MHFRQAASALPRLRRGPALDVADATAIAALA